MIALFLSQVSVRFILVETDSAFFALHLFKINICYLQPTAYVRVEVKTMFIAQILLCSSIAVKCIGIEDGAGMVSDIEICAKRLEAMVDDARETMPRFIVVSVDCKEVEGFAI